MSLNPFSQAPWVISVARRTVARVRGRLLVEWPHLRQLARPSQIGAGGHTVFKGDRIGDLPPRRDGARAEHLVDLLHGRHRDPRRARRRTTRTRRPRARAWPRRTSPAPPRCCSRPTRADAGPGPHGAPGDGDPGHRCERQRPRRSGRSATATSNLDAAVDVVRGNSWGARARQGVGKADDRVLAADGFKVLRSDFWTYDAPRGRRSPATDARQYSVDVDLQRHAPQGDALASVGRGPRRQRHELHGHGPRRERARCWARRPSRLTAGAGTASLFIDLRSFQNPRVTYGAFTFEVSRQLRRFGSRHARQRVAARPDGDAPGRPAREG